METVNILNVPINNVTMDTALELIEKSVDENVKSKIYFVNTFYLNAACEDEHYRDILNLGTYVFGDGTGVRMASKIVGHPLIGNVNGTDMIFPLSELCAKRKFRVFLLGSNPGVASDLQDWMEEKYPGIEVSGHHHGYFDREAERDEIVGKINDSNTDILLVGFSAPAQEVWIHEHASLLNCKVLMGVGGLFDVYAGEIYRPPLFLRKIGLEWLGRLYQEPRRLWRRYLLGNFLFLFRVFRWKFSRRVPTPNNAGREE